MDEIFMPLPDKSALIGANVTEQGFKTALGEFVDNASSKEDVSTAKQEAVQEAATEANVIASEKLEQAKEYTIAYAAANTHKVGLVELVPSMPITYVGVGVNGSLKIQNDARYTSIAFPVPPDTDVTFWNTSNVVTAGSGAGISYHTALPPTDANSVTAMTPHVSTHGTSDAYIHTRTPVGAKFAVVNTAITSLNYNVQWKAQVGYGVDKSKVFSPYTNMSEAQLAVAAKIGSTANMFDQQTNAIAQFYVSLTQNVIAWTDTKPNWRMAVVPVEAGAVYKLRIQGNTTQAKPAWLIGTLSLVGGQPITPASLTAIGDDWYTCIAPANTTFLLMNVDLDIDYPLVDMLDTFAVRKYTDATTKGVTHIAGTPVADQVARTHMQVPTMTGTANLFASAQLTTGYYISVVPNTLQLSAGGKVAVIPVKAGTRYKITYAAQASDIYRFRFMSDAVLREGKETVAGTDEVITSNTERYVTAPVGMTHMVLTAELINATFNFSIVATLQVSDYSKYQPTLREVVQLNGLSLYDAYAREKLSVLEKQVTNGASRLTGKKWIVIGDSITEKNYWSNYNYHYYLAKDVGGMTVYNYGISGTGYFNRNDVASKITQTDVDLITIFLGTNDWGNQTAENRKPLGVFGDTTTDTISGCIYVLITAMIVKFPITPMAILTPLPRATNWGVNAANNAYGYTLKNLVDLLHVYATHFSLQIIDLYAISNLYPYNATANDHFFKAPNYESGDGLHPNDAGHIAIAHKLRHKLEQII
ncbi:SGNH/GDSL hydrolase family protein [Acinetobacter sp. CFCC 10889]|uniref:SGNH/GDSL hydrolase family protein n=1 Tax=Acinetobacter sp. CFCC 10889 TaxID=1775557 RepID=UPI000DCF9281|nr:SGNH/GDSL hydrolase family protein [Acinetobacter sp. CFCC 10889]